MTPWEGTTRDMTRAELAHWQDQATKLVRRNRGLTRFQHTVALEQLAKSMRDIGQPAPAFAVSGGRCSTHSTRRWGSTAPSAGTDSWSACRPRAWSRETLHRDGQGPAQPVEAEGLMEAWEVGVMVVEALALVVGTCRRCRQRTRTMPTARLAGGAGRHGAYVCWHAGKTWAERTGAGVGGRLHRRG